MKKIVVNKKIVSYIVIAAIVIICGMQLYKNRRVHFEDEKMRQVICLELGKDKDEKNVTYRELEEIEELRIGPIGEFETIRDVAKCRNIKQLLVNVEITDRQPYYELFEKTADGKIYYPLIDKQKIERVQDDLEKILREDKKIEVFRFTNVNESCNITNFNFLKNAKNLKEIGISYGNVSNYSVLENCSRLENVDLWKSNIKTADVLLNLKYVNKFWLTGTPLAENEKEIKRLKEAFPEAEIIID